MSKAEILPSTSSFPFFLAVVNVESRSVHLSKLVQEAQQRVTELSAQVVSEGLGTESAEREKQLKGWEWRARLYQRMKDGYEHAREYGERATFPAGTCS